MQAAGWEFSPGVWPSLGALLLFPLLLALGFWQLDRADQKRALDIDFKDRQSAEAIDLNNSPDLRKNVDKLLWRRVTLDGTFSGSSVLLDNQVLGREAGYFVYTPFKLQNEKAWVLINRGWVSAGGDRKLSPQIANSDSNLRIFGDVKTPPYTGILLAENILEQLGSGVVRTQKLDLTEIEALLNIELLPYIVRLDAESPGGFARYWQLPGSGESKHLGYAFQWFALAAAVLLIYLILNIKRVK